MDNIRKKELVFLIFIFLFAFILRISYCFFFKENILHIQAHVFADTQQYVAVAENFLAGKGIILSPDIISKITPVYPLFLAVIYFLFGEGYWAIRIVQIIIGGLSCVLVYLIGKETTNPNTAKIAAFIAAIYPFFIFFTGFILAETLFVFLLLFTVFFFQRLQKFPCRKHAIFTGVLLGASILCRPSLIAFFFIFLISLFIPRLWFEWNDIFKRGIIVLLFTVLTLSPWIIRNLIHFNKFIPLTTMSGQVLWEGNNPYASGGPCEYWPEEIKGLSEIGRDKYLKNAAIGAIKGNPQRFIKLMGLKFLRFWNIVPNYKGFSSPLYNLISVFSYGPIIITAVLGVFLTRKFWRKFLLFYLLIISFTLGHMLFVSSIRYRVPIMPFVIIFSACTLDWLYNKCFRRKTSPR